MNRNVALLAVVGVLALAIVGCDGGETMALSPSSGACGQLIDLRLDGLRTGHGYLLGVQTTEDEGYDDPLTAEQESTVVRRHMGACTQPMKERVRLTLYHIELDETFTPVAHATYTVSPCLPYRSREAWCAPAP